MPSLLVVLTIYLWCIWNINYTFSQIQSYADVLPTDRETASRGNVLVAFPGYYYPDSQEILYQVMWT